MSILKWVGGKTQILDKVMSNTPNYMNNYHEPFLGGGSVLLEILSLQRQNKITINGNIYAYDYNERLINVYKQIQLCPEMVYETLKSYIDAYEASDNKEQYYYHIREAFNSDDLTCSQASRFIFLNKTCFRGLYRENKKGDYNVSFGNYKQPSFPTKEKIKEVSGLIQDVIFKCCDFTDALNDVEQGDYVYLDPPYTPEHSNSFVRYNSSGFTLEMHNTLFQGIHEISDTGAIFSMSNHKVDLVMNNFKEFKCIDFDAKRKINSKKPDTTTTEIIITNM
jgi:DNA adenine methylase